ncbi:MAG: hypothetical protein IJ563_12530 [Selenomonadaceae bacterium]|nr:hypothetical protein [Selenomonadaceae bacterium]MBR1858414.1 hypothetical protein [Selenomonadaceae bacterium]
MKKQFLKFVLPALVFGAVNFGSASASAETVEVSADIKSVISTNFEQPEIENYNMPRPPHRPGPPPPPHRRYPPPPPPPPPPGARGPHHPPGPYGPPPPPQHRPHHPPRPYGPPPPPPPRHRAVQDVEVNSMFNINDNVTESDIVQS